MKEMADLHYFQRGATCFSDPRAALTDYGKVLAGLMDQDAYAKRLFRKALAPAEQAKRERQLQASLRKVGAKLFHDLEAIPGFPRHDQAPAGALRPPQARPEAAVPGAAAPGPPPPG